MDQPHIAIPASDHLRLDARPAARGIRLTVRGELDSQTAPLLAETAAGLLARPGLGVVELDLAGLTFIDAAGIRSLLECESAAERAGARLEARDATAAVVRILDIVGLAHHFGFDTAASEGREIGPPRQDDDIGELLAWSTRARRNAHDICRRARDAVQRSSMLRDASS